MNPIEKREFHSLAQEPQKLMPVVESLWKEWINEIPSDLPGSKEIKKRYPLLFQNQWRANLQWMDYYCESPIERTLVGALLCVFARREPTSLIVAPNFLHRDDPIEAFDEFCKNVAGLADEILAGTNSPIEFLKAMDQCAEDGVIDKNSARYFQDHFLFYQVFDLSGAVHLNLQPALKKVRVDGRYIRPDMLFWSPNDPDFRVIAECDGFDYHSDKDAFTRDRRRDRVIRSKGMDVVRFSGSEIYNDTGSVAIELANFIMQNAKHRPPL